MTHSLGNAQSVRKNKYLHKMMYQPVAPLVIGRNAENVVRKSEIDKNKYLEREKEKKKDNDHNEIIQFNLPIYF